jgi:hypothetical protein
MIRRVRTAGCCVLVAAAMLAGCHRQTDEERAAAAAGPVKVDTADNAPLNGVSDEQLKAQAQALTPEQAAAQGMAQDSIHVEDLGGQDSTPAGTARNDTVARTAATAKSTPGHPAAPAVRP